MVLKFGNTSAKPSRLGFGAMRLPCIDKNPANIDYEKATEMIRYAIDNGVNYIDTAYVYHSEKSEEFLGYALSDGYRDKVYLATKSPVWKALKFEDYEIFLDTQLKRLKTDHLDMYLTHALDKERWVQLKKLDAFKFLDSMKKSGKIKYAGFSFHDELNAFKEIVDGYDWDFCQVQHNYIDRKYQAGTEGIDYAYEKGLGIVVMEPIKGGKLSKTPPDDIKNIWGSLLEDNTYSDLALRWVWNNPKVSVVLSGMNTLDQVKANISAMKKFGINNLNEEQKKIYERVREKFLEYTKVNCSACGYCMPCPQGVNIPGIFEIYNESIMFNNKEASINLYNLFYKDSGADKCVACGACEAQCPQNIQIIDTLREVREYFGV